MRLHPAVTQEDAQAWLQGQAAPLAAGLPAKDVDEALRSLAEAMAAVSAVVLPDDLEPLFP
jgi:hypothetical protein